MFNVQKQKAQWNYAKLKSDIFIHKPIIVGNTFYHVRQKTQLFSIEFLSLLLLHWLTPSDLIAWHYRLVIVFIAIKR